MNTNRSRSELEAKTLALAKYGGVSDAGKIQRLIGRAWNLEHEDSLHGFSI